VKRRIIAAAVTLAVAGSAAGCGANTRDLEGVPIRSPQKVEIYANLDGHPNIARQCIDGVAFMTTTRDYSSVLRVPEWDGWCKS
jgi:hypothetical protein